MMQLDPRSLVLLSGHTDIVQLYAIQSVQSELRISCVAQRKHVNLDSVLHGGGDVQLLEINVDHNSEIVHGSGHEPILIGHRIFEVSNDI